MITWEPSEEFLVAVQRPYGPTELVEARGLRGYIIEQITHDDYAEAWAWRGFDSDAISVSPRYYYRCKRIEDPENLYHGTETNKVDHSLGSTVPATSDQTGRGDQESAS